MSGLYTIVLDKSGNSTDRKIVDWTRWHGANTADTDSILAVDFNLGGFVRFSNSMEGRVSRNDPNAPINILRPGIPLMIRSHRVVSVSTPGLTNSHYRTVMKDTGQRQWNWFIEFVLSGYLQFRAIKLDPTPEVMARLGSRTPETVEEIIGLLRDNPSLIDNVQIKGIHSCQNKFRQRSKR